MTGTEPDVQWYIARDGKQYGPVSAVEMAKLVELNHLKATDLLWRPGFADWRPALAVFPPEARPGTRPATAMQPDRPAGSAAAGHAAAQAAARARMEPAAAAAADLRAAVDGRASRAQSQGGQPQDAKSQDAKSQDAKFQGVKSQGGKSQASHTQASHTQASHATAAAPAEPPSAAAYPKVATAGAGESARHVAVVAGKAPSARGRRPLVAAVAGLALLAVAGGGYYMLGRGGRSAATDTPKVAAAVSPAKTKPESAPAATPTATPAAAPAAGTVDPQAVDERLQKIAVWQRLKHDYADWYSARMKDVAAMPGDQRTEAAVDKQLVAALVALRRDNSEKALAAGTDKLKRVASAFLDNLGRLAHRDVNACFSFISQGESSPAVVPEITGTAEPGPMLQQILAILDAIADGTASPHQHEKPQKADYDALAGELTKLGWTQSDLQLFADPKALARAAPDKVCKMVQDWFAAHLAIGDGATQERLLVETLRPVVAG